MATTPKTRTLLVERAGKGRMTITIPATAKVTFGMLQPGVKGGHGWGEGSTLRIYEGTKQTAVFNNVTEFRDVAYPIAVEVVEEMFEESAEIADGQARKRKVSRERTGIFEPVSF